MSVIVSFSPHPKDKNRNQDQNKSESKNQNKDQNILIGNWIHLQDRSSFYHLIDALFDKKKITISDYQAQSRLKEFFSFEILEKRFLLPLPKDLQHYIGDFLSHLDLFPFIQTSKKQREIFDYAYWKRRLSRMENVEMSKLKDFEDTSLSPSARYLRAHKSFALLPEYREERRVDQLFVRAYQQNDQEALAEIQRTDPTVVQNHLGYYHNAFRLGKLNYPPAMLEHFRIQREIIPTWSKKNTLGEFKSMTMGLGYGGEEHYIVKLLQQYDQGINENFFTGLMEYFDFLFEGVVKGRRKELYKTLKDYDSKRFNDTRGLIMASRRHDEEKATTSLDSEDTVLESLRFILEQDNLQINYDLLVKEFHPKRLLEAEVKFLKSYPKYFSWLPNLTFIEKSPWEPLRYNDDYDY